MYEDHSVKRKILPFTEWSPDAQQFGAITQFVFLREKELLPKRGKEMVCQLVQKKELSHSFTQQAEKSHHHQANRRWTSKSLTTSLFYLLQRLPRSPRYNFLILPALLSLKAAMLWYSFYHPYNPHPYNPGAGHAIYPPLIKTKITMCLQKCPPKPRNRREVRRWGIL